MRGVLTALAFCTLPGMAAAQVYVPNAEVEPTIIIPERSLTEAEIFDAPRQLEPLQPGSPDSYTYSTMSGPFQNLFAALVVRSPAYSGLQEEQESAITEAKQVINERYCQPHENFTVNPQFIWFDNIQKLWGIAGQCLAQ